MNSTGSINWGIYRSVPVRVFDMKDDWIMRKEWSLNGFPFAVTIFSRYPTMIFRRALPQTFLKTHYARETSYSNGFGGFDGLVMGNLAKALNFQLQIIKRSPQDTYGSVLPNNTFTGTLGDVLYGEAEVSFNARFLLDYGTAQIEFMFPVLGDKMCIIAPSAQKIPQWTAIFKCFSVNVWITFATITCLCGCFWFLLRKCQIKISVSNQHKTLRHTIVERRPHIPFKANIENHIKDGHNNTVARYITQVQDVLVPIWMIMLGASTIMPERSMERLFISSCLLAHVIILGTFEVRKSTRIQLL